MGHVIAVAILTFREAVRARLIYALAAAGLVTMGAATVFAPLALGQTARIVKDVGVATIDALGMMVILLLGTSILYKEVEKRTIALLLSKPVRRAEFVLGKFLALTMALVMVVVVETAILEAALYLEIGAFDLGVLQAAGMALAGLVTMNAVAMLYSSVCSPILAAFLTLATFIAGRLAGDLADFAVAQHLTSLAVVFHCLPNLASMDLRPEIVHGAPVDVERVGLALAHAASYTVGALAITVLAFRNREFR